MDRGLYNVDKNLSRFDGVLRGAGEFCIRKTEASNKSRIPMKIKNVYTTPASQVLEVKPQEMLCWSGGGETYLFEILTGAPDGTRHNYDGAAEDTWY